MIWVIRTVVIADAAEHKRPIFSSSALEKYSKNKMLKNIIDNRDEVEMSTLISSAGNLVSQYYKRIQPKNQSYESVVKWMHSKGPIASSTPAYFENQQH